MRYLLFFSVVLLALVACNKDDDTCPKFIPNTVKVSTDTIDVYFDKVFNKPYGTMVDWKWDARDHDISKRVVPIKREFAIPMGKIIRKFWIGPFEDTPAGSKFIKRFFPCKIVFIGSPLYDSNGVAPVVAYAESGVIIVFSRVNGLQETRGWITNQVNTMEHEFAHIVSSYGYPDGYIQLHTELYGYDIYCAERKAISKGSVSAYGLTNVAENFAELMCTYLTHTGKEFTSKYITHETKAPAYDRGISTSALNFGKDIIKEKLEMTKKLYWERYHVDLDQVRDSFLKRLDDLDNK